MKETIMFTHNDLDGVGCGILHKAGFGMNAETHYCGYHNVDEKIVKTLKRIKAESTTFPTIIISDLGIKTETAELLDRYEGEKIMLDHHVTNLWLADRYEWATIDTEASGTLLVFNYFEEVPRRFSQFALLVDDFDRWVHAYPDSKQLNRLFFLMGIKRFENRCLTTRTPEKFYKFDKLMLEIEDESIEHYIAKLERNTVVYDLDGDKKLGIVFADRYQSEAGHELLDRLELDVVALIDANQRKISLRSVDSFDIGSIAKRLGGGGHKNAAGVEFKYKTVDDFNSRKYPLYGLQTGRADMLFTLYRKIREEYVAIENEAIESLMRGELQ